MGLRNTFAHSTGFSNGRDWDAARDLPDLTGKVCSRFTSLFLNQSLRGRLIARYFHILQIACVTGGNAGLGKITVQNLFEKGCKVYLAARSEEKANEAIQEILSENPQGKASNLVFLPFDMTDLKSIKKAAETIKEKEERLDIIVNNAVSFLPFALTFVPPDLPESGILIDKTSIQGVMAWPYKIVNGIEVQFVSFALSHLTSISRVDNRSQIRLVESSRSLRLRPPPTPTFEEDGTIEWSYLGSNRQRCFSRSHFRAQESRLFVHRRSQSRIWIDLETLRHVETCERFVLSRSPRTSEGREYKSEHQTFSSLRATDPQLTLTV